MLKDVLSPNLDVVFCGTARGRVSAKSGYYYAKQGNKFYKVLHEAKFTPHRLIPSDCYEIIQFGIGLTDLVHTEYGNDNEISEESYEIESFIQKMKHFKPKYIAFTSKTAAAYALGYYGITKLVRYGLHSKTIGESGVFILPSTSGRAQRFWDANYWHELKKLVS